MTINERIRHLRKDVLRLNQRQFALDLGMAQTGVSGMEQDGATVTDRVIKSISLSYNVSEDWLRDGVEPMFVPAPSFSLDEFVKQHGASQLELDIVKAYFELEPDLRRLLVQHFKDRIAADETAAEQEAEPTTEQLEAEYKKSRSVSVRNAGLSASNTTAATGTDKAAGQ